MAWPAMTKPDGRIFIGLQRHVQSGDVSRDLAVALLCALDTTPGQPVAVPALPGPGPRLQDVLADGPLDVTLHEGFEFWLDPDAADDPNVKASLERANASIYPTAKLAAAPAAYWCRRRRRVRPPGRRPRRGRSAPGSGYGRRRPVTGDTRRCRPPAASGRRGRSRRPVRGARKRVRPHRRRRPSPRTRSTAGRHPRPRVPQAHRRPPAPVRPWAAGYLRTSWFSPDRRACRSASVSASSTPSRSPASARSRLYAV